MQGAGLQPVLVRDVVAGGAVLGRGLGELIRHLTARGPSVYGKPADGDLVVSVQYSGADLHNHHSEAFPVCTTGAVCVCISG